MEGGAAAQEPPNGTEEVRNLPLAGALRLRATEQSFGPVSTGYVVRTQGPRGGAERRGSAVRPEQPAARHYRARSSAGGEARDEASATGADERASTNGRQLHGRDAPQTEPPEPAQKRRLLPHGEEAQVLGGLDLRRACACCCDRCKASLSCRYQRASLVAHSTPQRSYSCLLSVRRYQHALLEAQALAVELLGQKWRGATRRTPDDDEPEPESEPEPAP